MCFVTAAFNDVLAHAHKLRLLYRHRKEEPHAQDRTVLETMRLARILPFGPPFHHAGACPAAQNVCSGSRGDQATEDARDPVQAGRAQHAAGSGFPVVYRKSPQKIGMVGVQTDTRRASTHDVGFQLSTVHADALQDLLHFDDEACARDR